MATVVWEILGKLGGFVSNHDAAQAKRKLIRMGYDPSVSSEQKVVWGDLDSFQRVHQ